MNRIYNILLLLVLVTQVTYANNTPRRKYTKEKTIKKEFNVSAKALLEIKNSYGNLNITSWNENRTVIEVYIKTSGNNEKRVLEKLNEINVNFNANTDFVSAKTIFGNSGWGWSSGNVTIEVNYVVKLPVTNRVDLTNDYGGIYINKLNNTAKISCDYGKLDIGELWGDNNELRFDYTNNSRIGIFKNGRINADYSEFVVEKTVSLKLTADYTNSKIEKADYVNYNCDYGSLTVGDILNLEGNGDYLTLKIGNVFGNLNLESDYGSIKIDELTAKAGNVAIEAAYTGVRIGYAGNYSFQFDIKLDYADLSGKDDLNFTLKDSDYSNHKYLGYNQTPNTNNKVYIKSSYGGVSLSKR